MTLTSISKLGTAAKRVAAVVTVCAAYGIASFLAEPSASAAPAPPNAASLFSELTTLESMRPAMAAQAGQSVTLPAKPWIVRELGRANLTAQERRVLQQAPVSVTNGGSLAMATRSTATGLGDPVMSNVCNAKDVLGLSQATSSVYWGFTAGGINITYVSTPNVYWTSVSYTRTGYTVSTSQPGPPTHHMNGLVHTDFSLAYIGYPSYVMTQRFSFYGTGAWSASCG